MNVSPSRTNRIRTILGTSFTLGLIFDYFFYGVTPGVTIFLYTLLTLIILYGFAAYFSVRLSKATTLLSLVTAAFAFMTLIRDSSLLNIINVLAVLYLLLLLIRTANHTRGHLSSFRVADYFLTVPRTPLRIIKKFFVTLPDLRGSKPRTVQSQQRSQVVRGILITAPIIFIFVVLFMSADLVFQNAVNSLISFNISPELISHLILIGSVWVAGTGAYLVIFDRRPSDEAVESTPKKRATFGHVETNILLGSVNILFLLFILVQLTYLFGGHNHLTVAGLTYAEYARKGFFELITVALFTLVLLWMVANKSARTNLKHIMQFKFFTVALIVQVLIIMVSAFKRLGLYEQAYGFTPLRLFSHLFIVWLAAVFMFLTYYIITEQKEQWFARMSFFSAIGFLLVLNIMNPDSYIARQNVNRYHRTGKLDLYYLRNMSADAVPEIATLLQDKDPEMQKAVAQVLHRYRVNLNRDSHQWQSSHYARTRAQRIIDQHGDLLIDKADGAYDPFPTKFTL